MTALWGISGYSLAQIHMTSQPIMPYPACPAISVAFQVLLQTEYLVLHATSPHEVQHRIAIWERLGGHKHSDTHYLIHYCHGPVHAPFGGPAAFSYNLPNPFATNLSVDADRLVIVIVDATMPVFTFQNVFFACLSAQFATQIEIHVFSHCSSL